MSGREILALKKTSFDLPADVIARTAEIVTAVQKNGDAALRDFSQKFDRVSDPVFRMEVTEAERKAARQKIESEEPELFSYFLEASENIRLYHEKQKQESWFFHREGNLYGQMIRPLERVGVYVPGGLAFYPSTVMMNVVPAKVAGVGEIILCTPPAADGSIKNLLAVALADALGVDRIFKIGGGQAIAALAYGTETVPSVSKITGPGNSYVAAAKRLVAGTVGIDSIAGPSEVAILADDSANPDWIAADMFSQAEHGGDNACVLISIAPGLADRVEKSIEKLLPGMKRRDFIEKSIREKAISVETASLDEAFDILNHIAPEHAEFHTRLDTDLILSRVKNAGALFIGDHTPVATGDYFAGPNHVLPTNGTAVFSSPLGVHDFIKRSSFISFSPESLRTHGKKIAAMAESEDLPAHAFSVNVRMEKP